MALSIVLVNSAPSPAWSQDTLQHAYVTGAPVPDWLGLATQSGRDAIRLGEGCSGVAPGVNVLQAIAEVPAGDAVGLTLQVVDPVLGVQAEVCTVIERRRRVRRRAQLGPAPARPCHQRRGR